MTATLTASETDLQVALRRLAKADERLDQPMTPALVHVLRNDLTVIQLMLLGQQHAAEAQR